MSHKISTQELEELLSRTADTGDYTKAINLLLNYLDQDPQNISIYFYLGLLFVRIKKYSKGIEYLENAKSAALDPGQKLRCLVFLGKAYADTKAYSKAERAFREALQTGISDPSAYSALGAVFYERNMVSQAVDALKKALEIDPNYAGALNNLGFILIEMDQDLEEGINLCKRAVDLDPENFAYRDSLGKALMDHGFYSEAKIQLDKALQLSPKNNIIQNRIDELNHIMEKV